jgi:hypothetical protein
MNDDVKVLLNQAIRDLIVRENQDNSDWVRAVMDNINRALTEIKRIEKDMQISNISMIHAR